MSCWLAAVFSLWQPRDATRSLEQVIASGAVRESLRLRDYQAPKVQKESENIYASIYKYTYTNIYAPLTQLARSLLRLLTLRSLAATHLAAYARDDTIDCTNPFLFILFNISFCLSLLFISIGPQHMVIQLDMGIWTISSERQFVEILLFFSFLFQYSSFFSCFGSKEREKGKFCVAESWLAPRRTFKVSVVRFFLLSIYSDAVITKKKRWESWRRKNLAPCPYARY